MVKKLRHLCFAQLAEADRVGKENGYDARAEFGSLGWPLHHKPPTFNARWRAALEFRQTNNFRIVTEAPPFLHTAGRAAGTIAWLSIPHRERNQLCAELTSANRRQT